MIGGGGEEHVGEFVRASRPPRTAETSARSAPSASRTSMKLRNQLREPCGLGRRPGKRVEREARRRLSPSPRRRRRARGRARPARSGSSSLGTRFIMQVRVVRPRNQPSPRRATPKSSPARKRSRPARVCLEQRERRLRQHERDVALERVTEPLALVPDRISRGRGRRGRRRRPPRPGSGGARRRTGRRCRRWRGRSGRGASGT